MDIYYIDYENVNSFGLKGVQLLKENSQVNILYSKKADNVKIDALTQLMQSKAEIHFLPVHVGTPNALDFQLVTLLFLSYREGNRYFIISKDSGYDCCIKTARENKAPDVWRFQDIESSLSGSRSASLQPASAFVHAEASLPAAAPQPESAQAPEEVSAIAAVSEAEARGLEKATPESTDDKALEQAEEIPAFAGPKIQTAADEDPKQLPADGAASHRSRRRRRSSRKSSQAHTDLQTAEQKNLPQQDTAAEQENLPQQGKDAEQKNLPQQGKDAEQKNLPQQSKDAEQKNLPQQGKDADSQYHVTMQNADNSPAVSGSGPVRFPAGKVSEVISRRCGFTPDERQLVIISDVLRKAKNKQQFYSSIVRRCGQKEGLALYHTIRCAYNDLLAIEAS